MTYRHPTLAEQRAERAALIAKLGLEPEPQPCPPGERYCMTTGEFWGVVARRFGVDVANATMESAK